MIKFTIELSQEEGAILSLHALGHANFAPKGKDIVCSAVTTLLRTFVHCVESLPHWVGKIVAEQEGTLSVETKSLKVEMKDIYCGLSWFLVRGLEELGQDYPDRIRLHWQKTMRGCFYGT